MTYQNRLKSMKGQTIDDYTLDKVLDKMNRIGIKKLVNIKISGDTNINYHMILL